MKRAFKLMELHKTTKDAARTLLNQLIADSGLARDDPSRLSMHALQVALFVYIVSGCDVV